MKIRRKKKFGDYEIKKDMDITNMHVYGANANITVDKDVTVKITKNDIDTGSIGTEGNFVNNGRIDLEGSFAGNKKLKKVVIKSNVISKIGKKAFFRKSGKKLVIKVPKKLKKKYKKLLKKAKTNKYVVK